MIRLRALSLGFLCIATTVLQTACERRTNPDGTTSPHFIGEPNPANVRVPADKITDFNKLYSQNCLACHGEGATVSASMPMDNQIFLAILPEAALRETITNGIPGTRMPGFSQAQGGDFTKEQIDILVKGILAWKKPLDASAGPLPAYSAPLGDVVSGETVFVANCARCHGANGTGGPVAGSVVDSAYLGLVSDQYLRTVVIAGRPDLGMPNYHTYFPGKSMSDQEVSDVVAWLVSHRQNEYGQPLGQASANPATSTTVP